MAGGALNTVNPFGDGYRLVYFGEYIYQYTINKFNMTFCTHVSIVSGVCAWVCVHALV